MKIYVCSYCKPNNENPCSLIVDSDVDLPPNCPYPDEDGKPSIAPWRQVAGQVAESKRKT